MDRALSSAANLDHLVDSDEMVFHPLTAVETGHPRLLDNRLKVAIIYVVENTSKIPARPKFIPSRVDRDGTIVPRTLERIFTWRKGLRG